MSTLGAEDEPSIENQNKLIINYLPLDIAQSELEQLFGTIGKIQSAKIIRDRNTGISRGFGFIEYVDPNDAARAIDAYDGLVVKSKRLKVAYSRPIGGTEVTNIHVRNIDQTVSSKDVEQLFRQYGDVLRARILNDQTTGLSRGIAFVLFVHREDAERAVNALNGTTIDGFASRPLTVRFAMDQATKVSVLGNKLGSTSMSQSAINFRSPTAPDFYHHSLPAPNPATGFLPMQNAIPPISNFQAMDAAAAFELGVNYAAAAGGGPLRAPLQNQRFNPLGVPRQSPPSFSQPPSRSIMGDYCAPRPSFGAVISNPSATSSGLPLPRDLYAGGYVIYIYNLEHQATECDLWQLFGPFGAIKKVDVVMDRETNSCKGFGFVTMLRLEEAMAAIGYLNGFSYKNRVLQVSLKKVDASA